MGSLMQLVSYGAQDIYLGGIYNDTSDFYNYFDEDTNDIKEWKNDYRLIFRVGRPRILFLQM